jgi:hypothetical protein
MGALPPPHFHTCFLCPPLPQKYPSTNYEGRETYETKIILVQIMKEVKLMKPKVSLYKL